ncbi:MAG: family 78 glycoside hydrolase catalytic domain [Verrucomicrobia bacterium]|nr:family 78 glycoside hydrolase catalytic domain [Verrucomicrobiota bacterium]
MGDGQNEMVHSLTVGESFENPLGFHAAMPTFAWQLTAGRVEKQSAYQIVVSDNELPSAGTTLWDSGQVMSDQSVWIAYEGKPLSSGQRAYWQVKVWDEQGRESAWSETAWFELGLLHNRDWQGQWIRLDATVPEVPEAVEGEAAPPRPVYTPEYLRRDFESPGAIASARLYVTAKGLYEVWLNGEKVSRDEFVPGWTSYENRIETLTYDVTDRLRSGRNVVGAVLGEGWYAGRLMRAWKPVYPDRLPALLLQLAITYRDGTSDLIATDRTWRATNNGPIRSSGIYDGETYDAGLALGNWSSPEFDATAWQSVTIEPLQSNVALEPKRHTPVRITEELPATTITEPTPGQFVFDLGQNMVGQPRLTMPVRQGQTISIRCQKPRWWRRCFIDPDVVHRPTIHDDGCIGLKTKSYTGVRCTHVRRQVELLPGPTSAVTGKLSERR